VSHLLLADQHPLPVPTGVVEAVLAHQDSAGRSGFRFEEGQAVRLLSGPFAEAIGEIERLDDNGRVRVLLSIMGGRIPASVAVASLAPAA